MPGAGKCFTGQTQRTVRRATAVMTSESLINHFGEGLGDSFWEFLGNIVRDGG